MISQQRTTRNCAVCGSQFTPLPGADPVTCLRASCRRVAQQNHSRGLPCCVVCGVELSPHERAKGAACSRHECQAFQLSREIQQRTEAEKILKTKAEKYKCDVAERHQLDEQDLGLAIVPSNDRPLVNLPERRRRRFRDRLLGVISQAVARRYGSRLQPRSDNPEQGATTYQVRDDSVLTVLGNACATCRGYCCQQGGDHAFLHPETVLRYMQQHRDARPRHILDDYLSHIGPKAYHDACVYQGPDGCRLPRDMRSQICNDYICKGLAGFMWQVEAGTRQTVVVAANESGNITRVALLKDEQALETQVVEMENDKWKIKNAK